MPRETYAAEQLTEQVREYNENAEANPVGEPDGFDVYRQVQYDNDTSEWLEPLLDAIAPLDDRIEDYGYYDDSDQLTVTFVSGPLADDRTPYPLEDVEAVLDGDEDDEETEDGQ